MDAQAIPKDIMMAFQALREKEERAQDISRTIPKENERIHRGLLGVARNVGGRKTENNRKASRKCTKKPNAGQSGHFVVTGHLGDEQTPRDTNELEKSNREAACVLDFPGNRGGDGEP